MSEDSNRNKTNIQAILKLCREVASEENADLPDVIQCAIVNELWSATNINISQLTLMEQNLTPSKAHPIRMDG